MGLILPIHIIAGGLGLVCGYVALYAAKGATLHRRSGRLFVYAMLTMSVLGIVIAAARNVAPTMNIPAGLLTFYLVITGLMTVRPLAPDTRRLNRGAMLLGMITTLLCFAFAIEAIAGGGARSGMAYPLVMFGVVGLAASIGDQRMIRTGGLQGAPRLARHLWRMCFALFIAALSFFFGQQKVMPEAVRIPALLALPILAVLVTMVFWMWRVRARRNFSRIVAVSVPEAV